MSHNLSKSNSYNIDQFRRYPYFWNLGLQNSPKLTKTLFKKNFMYMFLSSASDEVRYRVLLDICISVFPCLLELWEGNPSITSDQGSRLSVLLHSWFKIHNFIKIGARWNSVLMILLIWRMLCTRAHRKGCCWNKTIFMKISSKNYASHHHTVTKSLLKNSWLKKNWQDHKIFQVFSNF